MTTLIADLEAGPGSRELSDRVLLALGAEILKVGADQRSWRWRFGSIEMSGFSRPDPTRSVDDALALTDMDLDMERRKDYAMAYIRIYPDIPGEAWGENALPRAICIMAVIRSD